MKTHPNHIELLKKVSRKQLQFGLLIVFLSMVILYLTTRYYIRAEAEESLYSSTFRIEQLLKKQQVVSLNPLYEVAQVEHLKTQFLKDTLIFDEQQNEIELFRELNTFKQINGVNYRITTRTLFADYNDTLLSILISFAIIVSLALLAQYFYNKSVNKKIWKPFFKNLEAIKAFSLQSNQSISLSDSDVLEFSELNQHIKTLTEKVTSDYQNLKQFTEDVSHEVQTPLSIIQAKIENLMDNQTSLDDDQITVLNDIQNSAKRLSRLNQGLILLTKIENQQFSNKEIVDVNAIVTQLIEDFEDISSIKNLKITYAANETIQLNMDKVLTNVLFSNLLGNAIKYTPEHGQIFISTEGNSISIGNSGEKAIANSEKLFQRFYKEDKQSQSLGLGLAIVKKICDYYGFQIVYSFEDGMHYFSIKF